MAEGKVATLPEIPLELIQEVAATKSDTVAVRVTRRNSKGVLQTIQGWMHTVIPTLDLVNIEQQLRDQAGGGAYRVEPKNPQNTTEYIIPPFFVNIEGMPRPVAPTDYVPAAPAYPGGYGGPGMAPPHPGFIPPGMPVPTQQQMPAMQATPDAWSRGLSPEARAYYQHVQTGFPYPQMQVQHEPAPGASMPSDQMALRQIGDMKAEIAGLKKERDNLTEKLDDQREVHAAEIAKMREKHERESAEVAKKLDKLNEDAREARQEQRMEKLRFDMELRAAQTAAQTAALSAPKDEGFTKYLPAVIAWMENSSKRDLAQQSSQTQLFAAMLTQKPEKDDSLVKMMPFFLETARQKSPEAQAAVMDQLMQSQMGQLGMQAQIIQMMMEARGENESPWAALLQQALGGGMEMFGAFMDEKKKQTAAKMGAGPTLVQRGLPPTTLHPSAAPQQSPQSTPAQQRGPAAPPTQFPPGASYVTTQGETMAQTVAKPNGSNGANGNGHAKPTATGAPPPTPMSPEQLVKMIMQAPQVPADFKTTEWAEILLRIHRRDPFEKVAEVLLPHLDTLAQHGALPKDIERLFDDPAGTITSLLVNLPISQYDLQYATQLRDYTVNAIYAALQTANSSPPAPGAEPTATLEDDLAEDAPGDEGGDADEPEEGETEDGDDAAPPAVVDSLSLRPGRR